MDIFTLEHSGGTYKHGKIINGLYKKIWVERYLEPGEFAVIGLPTKELREDLAIGTLISHTNSKEVMIVEDHEIKDEGGVPTFTVTGRSLDSFLESRVATDDGMGFNGPHDDGPSFPSAGSTMYDGTAWPFRFDNITPPNLVVQLMKNAMDPTLAVRSSFQIPDISISNSITTTYTADDVDVPRGDLYSQIKDILDGIDAGIKVRRPDSTHDKIRFIVHKGDNKRSSVRFSYLRGEIGKSRYFWSSRNHRNAAYVSTRYQGVYLKLESTTHNGFDRRVMFMDATDINKASNSSGISKIESILKTRATRELKKRKTKTIFEATLAPNNRYVFRKDYDVGDLVYVDGNYDISAVMRVTEFVETDEGAGTVGVPTLESVRVIDEETDSDLDVYSWNTEGGSYGSG